MDLRDELDALLEAPERAARPRLSPFLAAPVLAVATVALAVGMGHAVDGVVGIPGPRDSEPAGEPGRYAFIQTQPFSGEPVTFDPCTPIRVTVNPDHAPEGYEQMVRTATERVGNATGFRFDLMAETSDRRIDARVSLRDLGASDPVLVLWADPSEVDDLAGDVAGAATSNSIPTAAGHVEFVTGAIALDRAAYAEMSATPDGRVAAQQILVHEFAHLVGLDHVDNPAELMNPEYLGQSGFGPGDQEGLAQLGATPCRNN